VLNADTLPALQEALGGLGLDGWLLFDFQGKNPIAGDVLGFRGMVTRRHLAFVPRDGLPVAVLHRVEPGPWRDWPAAWTRRPYTAWTELEAILRDVVAGKRVAMEYSPGNAVPYLDRVPAGVLEMVRDAGATVVSSAELVTRFHAAWAPEHLASHLRTADKVAAVAHEAFALVGRHARSGARLTEHGVQRRIVGEFERAGLVSDHPPIVAAGPNAAEVHYQPAAHRARPITTGDVLLVDLWAKEPDGVYADQTWMGIVGAPSPRVLDVWDAVRSSRDGALDLVRSCVEAGTPLRGREVHDEARRILSERGYADFAVGRTGHSIDRRSLHGAGPNIDGVETRDERRLVSGIAFSIEPGIYIPGEFGMRSEVNVYLAPGEVLITPQPYQRDLIVI